MAAEKIIILGTGGNCVDILETLICDSPTGAIALVASYQIVNTLARDIPASPAP